MPNKPVKFKDNRIALPSKNLTEDNLTFWLNKYLNEEVSSNELTRKAVTRVIDQFIVYIIAKFGNDRLEHWTPSISDLFKRELSHNKIEKKIVDEKGEEYTIKKTRWNKNSIITMMTYIKTFANYVHDVRGFPNGKNPMRKLKLGSTGTMMGKEKAITPAERLKILDAANDLLDQRVVSKDSNRYQIDELDKLKNKIRDRKKLKDPPRLKYSRPYRDRAIIYTLIETGMRRAEVTEILIGDVDFQKKEIKVITKGGNVGEKIITKLGLSAIRDYIENERDIDNEVLESSFLFLPTHHLKVKKEKMSPGTINRIWNKVCERVGVKGKTPHSARHHFAMKVLKHPDGTVQAVKEALGHQDPRYSMQYMGVSKDKIRKIVEE